MVTTVKLQDVFEYSWWVVLIAAVLLVIAIAILVYAVFQFVKFYKKIPRQPAATKIQRSPYFLEKIKREYQARISELLNSYTQGKVTKRDGYQRLSYLIRSFVHEATGINVENLTKSEVKALGIRKLDRLMEEYYVPEFAEDEKAVEKDLSASCNTAMGVIRTWN